MHLLGRVRASLRSLPEGTDTEVSLSREGGLHIAQVSLRKSELARRGRMFGATSATGTAIAPVAAVPTTAAAWALYNAEPDGGRWYHIDTAFCWGVSGTLGLGMALLVTVPMVKQAAVVADYTASILGSLSGGVAQDGAPAASRARFTQALTLTGPQSPWITVGARSQVAAVEVGSGIVAELDGKFVIPPGFFFGMTVLAPGGTNALFGVGCTWAEL